MPSTASAPAPSQAPIAARAAPDGRPAARWLRLLAPAAWAGLAALAAASVRGLEPNLVEEGMMLHVAERLAGGERLYRDVVFFTGPLPFELLAGLFRVFGAKLEAGRWFMVGAQAAAASALFVFARRAGAGAFAHAAAAVVAVSPVLLFPLFTGFYYTPLALVLAYLAAGATLLGVTAPPWAAAAGALCAAVALCKQTLGVMLAGALLAALVGTSARGVRVRRLLAFAAGGAAAAAVTLVAFAARGDLSALWHWLVVVPLSLESRYNSPMINFWPLGELGPEIFANSPLYVPNHWFQLYGIVTRITRAMMLTTQLLYALPFLALAATALARFARPLPAGVWMNGAVLVAFTSNLFPRTDWGHLVFALPPAVIQLCLLAGRIGAARERRSRGMLLAAAVCAVALLASGAGFAVWLNQASGAASYGPRVPLRPVSLAYRMRPLPNVIQYLRQRVAPGEPIFVARAEPLIYFATGTTNPTPYPGVLTAFSREQEEAILAALPRARFVVMSEVDQPLWTYYSEELPRVQAELERHYRVAPYFPTELDTWIVVLERDGDRGETAIDLIEEPARNFVNDAPGKESEALRPAPRLPARLNRRTLGMRLGQWGGGLEWQLAVPPGGRLQLDTGLIGIASAENMHEHPLMSRIMISIKRGDGSFEPLARQVLHLRRSDTPHWQPVEVDLSKFAGERVTLRVALEPEFAVGRSDLAWLGSPRVALAPASAALDADAPPPPSQ